MFIGEEGAGRLDRASEARIRMDNLAKAKEWEKSFGELEGNPTEAKRLQEAAKQVRKLKSIEASSAPIDKLNAHNQFKKIGSVNKDGKEVTFYNSAFKKVHKAGGLFEQAIPALKEAFENSVLAYSEKDNLGGMLRPDGTTHKEHKNVDSFDNYVGKVRIGGKEYYVRYTVQNNRGGDSGTHSMFVTDVEIYENPTEGRTIPLTLRGTTDHDGIVDAKLQRFFALASGNAHEFAKAVKFATGWERGKDGKWRYEMPDGEARIDGLARHDKLADNFDWGKELNVLIDRIVEKEETLSEKDMQRFNELSLRYSELAKTYESLETRYLDDYLKNDELFAAYPELKQIRVELYNDPASNTGATYYEQENLIRVNKAALEWEEFDTILIHEVQHAIQQIEGFAMGGNVNTYRQHLEALKPKFDAWRVRDELAEKREELGGDVSDMDVYNALIKEYSDAGLSFGDKLMPSRETFDKGFNLWVRGYDNEGYEDAYNEYSSLVDKFGLGVDNNRYRNLAGEVEARNVSRRMSMPEEMRRANLAEDTEDVSREEQIVLDGEYGVRFSLRTKQEPRETVDVWKLMRLGEDGLLYPLYIDRNTKGLELNKWYDADAPKIDPVKFAKGNSYLVDWDGNIHDVIPGLEGQATTIKGKKPSKAQIKDAAAKGMRWIGVTPYANGNKCFINIGIAGSTKNAKGEGGVGGFAMRPGWHAGALPSMKQIPGRSDDMVWVKGKIAYGNGAPEEAASNPGNEITTHIPVDGGYMKATSSFNEKSVDWFISGAFMPEEIMSDEDAKKAIDEYNAENGTQVPYDVPRPNGKLYDAKTNSFYQPKEGVVRFSLSEVNEQFNEDLQKQIDGTLPKGHVYQLGRPSDILKSTGIPDLPIEMSASKLLLKASVSYSSDHPFNLEDITNLPQAIQRPIAVFDSKNKVGCKVILVELTSDKGINFVVAMNTNVPKNRYSKESIQINDIRSVYPKDNVQDIVNWINRGDLLRYVDKKKIKEWITQRRSNSAEVEIQNLDVAAKLVQDFENPKISEENLSENSSVKFSLPPTRVENAEGKGGEVYREAYAADLYESRMANGMVQFREAIKQMHLFYFNLKYFH